MTRGLPIMAWSFDPGTPCHGHGIANMKARAARAVMDFVGLRPAA
jgi:hypothetical protein